ncbi:MAG: DUF4194 domain-containing protein [Hyphomicrobiales bacterium]|nr:MAG: DUF4194 domain-containing protein [Hyphomicrobiales bacterium]
MLESRRLITTRLHDLLLDLHIDTTSRVAYEVRAPLGADVTAPNLLRNTKWTAYQTALLVVLRERLRARTAPSDPVYADFAEIVDAMTHILPKTPDETRPTTITRQELTSLSRVGIVKQIADDDRYRISPVLESLLPLPKLKQLLEALRATNSSDDATILAAIESTSSADTDGER